MKNAMIELNANMESLRHAVSAARAAFSTLMRDDSIPLSARVKAFEECADELLHMGDYLSDSPFNEERRDYQHAYCNRGEIVYLTDVLESVLEYANSFMRTPDEWKDASNDYVLDEIQKNWPEIKKLVEEHIHSEVYAYRIDW